ncbi:single-stranded-DNA-specific exonuclease RecJ [bacterium]|nr:MAG: single-stranded-DNA-specific exonuclease RecJ [bacterium]
MNKLWKINKNAPKEFLKKFKDYHPLLLQLLYSRGFKTKKEIENFLSIDYQKDIHDPYLLSGMKSAVHRIKKAISNKEKVVIFGDYDADGICASTILNEVFEKINLHPMVYIPSRKEGYSLNEKAINHLAKKKVNLIVTVDCGSSSKKEVDLANKLGMDMIITDHHIVPSKIPKAYVILNPKKKNDKYPNKNLSGTGVAFKFATAIIREFPLKFKHEEEKWLLDLVAIATIADMMKLIGENRTLVKYGLLVLAKTRRRGLKVLLKDAGIKDIKIQWLDKKKNRFLVKNIDSYTISFIIGPRLNAAGRMDDANTAFYLLNTSSFEQARQFSKELNKKNQARQKLQSILTKKIQESLTQKELRKKFILRGSKTYPSGIVGLISGKLTNKFYLPSFIYKKGNIFSKGSCRSIPEINIVDILTSCATYLEAYGGHKGAAGFTIKNAMLGKFRKCLEKNINEILKGKKLAPKLKIDCEIDFQSIDYKLRKVLEELAPFGEGNSEPVFIIKKAIVTEKRKVGKRSQHLILQLKKIEADKEYYLKALLFQNTVGLEGIEKDKCYDFVFMLLFDEWKGKKQVTLKIIDWKESREELSKK